MRAEFRVANYVHTHKNALRIIYYAARLELVYNKSGSEVGRFELKNILLSRFPAP